LIVETSVVKLPLLPRLPRGGPLAAATAAVLLALPAACASAHELRVGVAPTLPAGTTLVASDASVRSLQITITLAPRDPGALNSYADGVSSPGNADFRHFLTTSQFRARFAPTRATVRAVERSLRAHGLQPGSLDKSGLALTVRASSGAIERAFKLTLSEVRLRDGRDAIFNVQAPAVDARIAGAVQAVIGLSTLYPAQGTAVRGSSNPLLAARARAASVKTRVATGGPQPCSQAVDDAPGSGGYTADQIASYYDFSPLYEAGDKGQGVTMAVYELESDAPSDIAAYERCYGIHTKITYVKVDGGSGSGAGSGEAALDIDQIIGLAPKVKLLVYQGPNSNNGTGPYKTYAAIADQDKASVVSTSWGNCEPEETLPQAQAEATVFEQMAVQGQTLVAAAGDSGSQDCWIGGAGGNSNNSLEVDDPASQPFVTGVGGTSLELGVFNIGGNGNQTYPTANPNETVWNNSYPGLQYAATWGIAPGAGGGGISAFWPMPAYQSTAATTAPWLDIENSESSGANCGAGIGGYCREVPDVSADADPMDGYMTYWNGQGHDGNNALSGWQSIGGTSASTPLWATVFALAEASRACAGNLIGFANPALYALASSSPSAYASYFNDVTNDAINQAGNDNDLTASGNTAGLFEADPGYDMATGLGTPNAANLAPALCREALQVHAAGVRQSFRGARVSVRVSASPPSGQSGNVTYSAKHLPAGLRINPTTGVVSGKITRAGVYDTVFGASVSGGDVGARSYVWTVADRPAASALSLADTGTGRPLLAFTLSAGRNESALRSVLVKLPAGVSLRRPLHGITVTGAAGRSVPHRLSLLHGDLVISFKPAHSPDKVVFNTGALSSQGGLLAGSVTPVTLVLRVIDGDGASTTVRCHITPAS
jgi:subtilase family serine protease